MNLLLKLTLIAGSVLVFGFAAIVLLQMVTGRIPLKGLVATKERDGTGSFSPARLQLLIFTVVVALLYLHAVIVNPNLDSLPTLPQEVIAALGGSHAVYLGGKALTAFIQPLVKNLK